MNKGLTLPDGFSISIDIGGTFTDCTIVAPDGDITVAKASSTPDEFSRGFFDSIDAGAVALGTTTEDLLLATRRLSHGTTVGINAVVSRTGARVGLLATRGHGDSLRLLNTEGRTNGMPVEKILNYADSSLPEQFVQRADIVEIDERIDCFGDVVVDLAVDQVREAATTLLERGVETLAVSFLWSHLNPVHEEAAVAAIAEAFPDVYVSSGQQLAKTIGEYPRTATAVLNSYIGPLMRGYVTQLLDGLHDRRYEGRLLFAQCDGVLVDARDVASRPIMTLESGPVGGVVACGHAGAAQDEQNIIATDMGGTTFDVSVIAGGELPLRDGVVVDQHSLYLRMVDVESVGAGGGSLAWIDPQSGALRVGPQSAGANPGPVCYGRGGTQPTVTDADLVLGLLNPDNFLGGRMRLDVEAARNAISELADQLGMDVMQCAAGIQEVADSLMEDKIRSMTIARGHDPRDFTLYAFGGGGGVHVGLFSRGLGIRKAVVPVGDLASVWSAYGIGQEQYGRTYELPVFMRAPFDPGEVDEAFARLVDQGRRDAESSEVRWDALDLKRSADLKYALQVYDVEVPIANRDVDEVAMTALAEDFEQAYETRFGQGSGFPEGGIDLTMLRVVVGAANGSIGERGSVTSAGDPTAGSQAGERQVFWPELGGTVATPVYDGNALEAGTELVGPALLDYPDTSVVLRPELRLTVEQNRNLVIDLEKRNA